MKRMQAFAGLAILGALMMHVGVFWFITIDNRPLKEPPEPSVVIEYNGDLNAGRDPGLIQLALLNDSAPLFMPTRWNLSGNFDGVASLRAATEVFALFPPELHLPDAAPEDATIPGEAGPGLVASLPVATGFVFAPYGVRETAAPGSIDRRPVARAVPLQQTTADPVSPVEISIDLAAQQPDSIWAPPTFYVQIKEGKPVGFPILDKSSGFADWDQRLLEYVNSVEFYRLLGNGYYRLTVYP